MGAAGVQALSITSSPTLNRDAGLLARLALEMGMAMVWRVGRQRAIRGPVPIRGGLAADRDQPIGEWGLCSQVRTLPTRRSDYGALWRLCDAWRVFHRH